MSKPKDWRVDWDACPAQLVEVIRQAVGSIGIQEVPAHSNRGDQIDRWNAAAGAPLGSKYCVSFIHAMYAFAVSGNPLPKTASVSSLAAWGEREGKLVHAGSVLPGDIGCILREGPAGDEYHHAVLMVADLGDGRCACVEANHGDQVAPTIRGGGEFTKILRM